MEELFKERKEKLSLFKAFRNKKSKLNKKEVPEGIYIKCDECQETILSTNLINNLYVCPHCQAHLKVDAKKRIEMVTDPNTFKEFNRKMLIQNPLNFPGYVSKIKNLQEQTGLDEAVVTGIGKIDGITSVIAVMDSRFIMGSMGSVVGEKITQAIEYATKKSLPIIIFSASGGARMQEGIVSLMQMAKTSQAIAKHHQKGLLYISYITHPTTGGVTASFASLGDIIIGEPNALMGFAGPRVIEQTIKQKLPEGFQRSEFMLKHGFIDLIVPRDKMKTTLSTLLKLHTKGGC